MTSISFALFTSTTFCLDVMGEFVNSLATFEPDNGVKRTSIDLRDNEQVNHYIHLHTCILNKQKKAMHITN